MINVNNASIKFSNSVNKSFLKGGFFRATEDEGYALNNINVDILPGDRIGIIGRNGSGKTTFLRMLAGIHTPSSGKVISTGSVSCLTELGLYSDGEMTGRDVISLEAIGRGLTGKDLKGAVSKSVKWTELGSAIDRPIKTYSTGMQLRVSIASATILPADILLMDEWLSVGDAAFQTKTENRLQSLLRYSNIFVIATHSMETIYRLCNKVIVLSDGNMLFNGDVSNGINLYKKISEAKI